MDSHTKIIAVVSICIAAEYATLKKNCEGQYFPGSLSLSISLSLSEG